MAARRIGGDGRDKTQETLRADADGAVVRVVGLEMADSGLAGVCWRHRGVEEVAWVWAEAGGPLFGQRHTGPSDPTRKRRA